jgi:hypothetical protein
MFTGFTIELAAMGEMRPKEEKGAMKPKEEKAWEQ